MRRYTEGTKQDSPLVPVSIRLRKHHVEEFNAVADLKGVQFGQFFRTFVEDAIGQDPRPDANESYRQAADTLEQLQAMHQQLGELIASLRTFVVANRKTNSCASGTESTRSESEHGFDLDFEVT